MMWPRWFFEAYWDNIVVDTTKIDDDIVTCNFCPTLWNIISDDDSDNVIYNHMMNHEEEIALVRIANLGV